MPCDQSKLASGMFPTEQTNEIIAMIGPTSAFSIKRTTGGPLFRNKASHQPCGISVARNPAIKNPPKISFQSIDQSVTNACATPVHFSPHAHARLPTAGQMKDGAHGGNAWILEFFLGPGFESQFQDFSV